MVRVRALRKKVAAIKMLLELLEQLDFLVRFWELKARHAHQGEPLTAAEQLELLSLLQLVSNDLAVPPRTRDRASNRSRVGIPVQLIGDGAMVIAELRTVSAGALLVASSTSFSAGVRLIVRVTDAVAGIEFSLPCAVAWSMAGTPDHMALTPDGVPLRARLIAPVGANTYFPMGVRPRMVG
ncbi:MAG: PilZ domain-containing protein [Polyangiaceae bacterium]